MRRRVLVVETQYTFGDEVRFDSALQGCRGTGTIYAITIDEARHVDYMIKTGDDETLGLQPGIQEVEIVLLE